MGADQNIDFRATIASALEWWHAAGVDCEIDDVPRDWLARTPVVEKGPDPIAGAIAPERKMPQLLSGFAVWRLGADAPEAAWPGQALATQGNPSSGLMIVVDMPDREDDATGSLLSGAAGRLFDRMLAAIGRDRQSVYLAALTVKRPPAARIGGDVASALEGIMRHHIALAAPKRVLVLGNAASRAVTGMDVSDARGSLRGVNQIDGSVGVVASFHPRFLLERPVAKADAWRDLQLLIEDVK